MLFKKDVIDGTQGKRAIFPMPDEDVTVNVTFILAFIKREIIQICRVDLQLR